MATLRITFLHGMDIWDHLITARLGHGRGKKAMKSRLCGGEGEKPLFLMRETGH
jgi:hypothetical protein